MSQTQRIACSMTPQWKQQWAGLWSHLCLSVTVRRSLLSLYLCLHSENRVTSKLMSISRRPAVWPLPGRLLLFLCYLGTGQRLLSGTWRGDVVSTNHPWNVVRGAEGSETGMVKGWTGMMCSSHPPPLEKAEKVNSTPHTPRVMSKNLLEESSFAWVPFK